MSVSLRKFTLQDAPRVAELVGDEAVSRWMSSVPYPYTVTDAEEWISAMQPGAIRTPFAVDADGQLAGCVAYWPLDEDAASGDGESEAAMEVGYWIGRPYWGRGLCTTALQLMLGDETFPANADVYAKIMTANQASRRVLEKCGFSYVDDCTIEKFGKTLSAKCFKRVL